MRRVLEATPNLHLREGMATNLRVNANDEAVGVDTYFGMAFHAKAVVITTGTFMNGTIWVGRKAMPAGRCAAGAIHWQPACIRHRPALRSTGGLQRSSACEARASLQASQHAANACRAGEAPSVGLTEHLQELGFSTERLKTGTPARVDRRTVDFSKMTEQPGDEKVGWFSFDTAWHVEREQQPCHLTYTNEVRAQAGAGAVGTVSS